MAHGLVLKRRHQIVIENRILTHRINADLRQRSALQADTVTTAEDFWRTQTAQSIINQKPAIPTSRFDSANIRDG